MLRPSTYSELTEAAGGGDFIDLVKPELLSDVSEQLLALGARIVGLKLGDRGFYLRTASETQLRQMGRATPVQIGAWAGCELWAPCFQANLVGTTGAGDATIAGFLGGLLRGLAVEQAVTMAVAVGACNVEAADALSGLRSWDETMGRVAAGWQRLPLSLDAPGWSEDVGTGLWTRNGI